MHPFNPLQAILFTKLKRHAINCLLEYVFSRLLSSPHDKHPCQPMLILATTGSCLTETNAHEPC